MVIIVYNPAIDTFFCRTQVVFNHVSYVNILDTVMVIEKQIVRLINIFFKDNMRQR